MKDTSRPRPAAPPSRSTPYRKRKSSAAVSPTRRTRRQYDASPSEGIPPRSPERALTLRHDMAQPSRAVSSADPSNVEANRPANRPLGHTSTDGPTRERPSHTSVTSVHSHVEDIDIYLRLAPASAPPTISTFNGQRKAESPPPGSVTAFLRSIELPDKPPSSVVPPLQPPFSLTPTTPSLSTDNASKAATNGNGNGYQVSLVYKGYPFTYDLTVLPDDPKGTIALLATTQSDPGAYIIVGTHYRRTGRPRAACAVIRSLLDTLDSPSDVEKTGGDAAPMPLSGASVVTLATSDSPTSSKQVDLPTSAYKRTAMRPALLLLAACELDISRERPGKPDSAIHASAAHDLLRTVYGTVNDAIVAEAARPQPNNALGLNFLGSRTCLGTSASDSSSRPPPHSACTHEAESLAHIKDLEKELGVARTAQKKLQEKLAISNDRLSRYEDKVYVLESRSREARGQLDASREEIWRLRQRLAESEKRAREMPQSMPTSDNRMWGKLKDLLFDNFGEGVRGE